MSQQVGFETVPLGLALRRELYELGLDVPAETASLRERRDQAARRFALELRAWVTAERLPPETVTRQVTVETPVPATWWQMWREKHMHRPWMAWTLGRWPIRYTTLSHTVEMTVELKRFWVYPYAPMQADFGKRYRVSTWDTMIDGWDEEAPQ